MGEPAATTTPSGPRKATAFQLVFMTYAVICSGAYGLEEIVSFTVPASPSGQSSLPSWMPGANAVRMKPISPFVGGLGKDAGGAVTGADDGATGAAPANAVTAASAVNTIGRKRRIVAPITASHGAYPA